MVVQDGLETVVCPMIVDAEVVPCSMNARKFTLSGSASTLLRFVPSVPISRKFSFGASPIRMAASCGVTIDRFA